MNQERINEIVTLIKGNEETKMAFAILDEISTFLKEDKKFFDFASKQAKKGYVSPMEMIMLAHDYKNNTGKYEAWQNKIKDRANKNTVKNKVSKEDVKFVAGFEVDKANKADLEKFLTIKAIAITKNDTSGLIATSEEDHLRNTVRAWINKDSSKKVKVAVFKAPSQEILDTQLSLFTEEVK